MRPKLTDLFPTSLLDEMVADRYVRRFEHQNGDLVGYSYSERAQWEGIWNACTRQCRGVIADTDGNLLARPFPKFFNLGDDPETDAVYARRPFELHEKLDGSLGILFLWDGQPHIATKGAFHSTQAEWATEAIRRMGAPADADATTYLFEIIYPSNRIIVDYADRSELALLDALRLSDGTRVERTWPSSTRRFDVPAGTSASEVAAMFQHLDTGAFEGFVAVYDDGHRVKIKLSEYVRLHGILTQTSTRSVWAALAAGEDPRLSDEAIPDEFHRWVREQIDRFTTAYAAIERENEQRFAEISHLLPDRKAFAQQATRSPLPSLLFSMADGKDYAEAIWKQLRPTEIEYPPNHV